MRTLSLFIAAFMLVIFGVSTVSYAQNKEGYLDDWLVLGIFQYSPDQERLAVDFIGGEKDVIPHAGDMVGGKAWKKMHTDLRGKLDFIRSGDFGNTEYSVCYAHTFIKSPVEQNAYLLIGSDDAVSACMNGINVHYHEVPRGWRADQDTAMVRLGQGWNRLLVKVANGVGDFALSVRLVNKRFEPIADVQVQGDNPAGTAGFTTVSVSPWLRIRQAAFSGFRLEKNDLQLELAVDVQNLGTINPSSAKIRVSGVSAKQKEHSIETYPLDHAVFQFSTGELRKLFQNGDPLTIDISWGQHVERMTLPVHAWETLDALFAGVKLGGWKFQEGLVDVTRLGQSEFADWKQYPPEEEIDRAITLGTTFTIPSELSGYPLRLSIPQVADEAHHWVNGLEPAARWLITNSARKGEPCTIVVWADSLHMDDPFEARLVPSSPAFARMRDNGRWAPVFTDSLVSLDEQTGAQVLGTAFRENKTEFERLVENENARFLAISPQIKENTIHVIGNAHIDMAWLWPWTETVDVCRMTFENALNNMNRYPEYLYAQSQARAYVWIEERFPEMFEEIRRRVKEGRWCIVGGTWVEPDNNLPGGESLVRQILYGKRYFRERFGIDVVIAWLPDSFGYAWTLPQIYGKAGFKYFITQKLTWNEVNEFPYKAFWWESADGSRLFSYFPYTYTHDLNAGQLASQYLDHREHTGLQDQLVLYGEGDHGGGPSRQMIERARRLQKIDTYPTVVQDTPLSFLSNLEEKTTDLPVWKDELYLEYHQGTYTTQALIKKRNRRCETLLETAEKFSCFSSARYPQDELEAGWKGTLFNQFHDILPGSCIREVAVDAHKDYDAIEKTVQNVIERSLKNISGRVRTKGNGIPVVIFNPLSWSRDDLVTVTLPRTLKENTSVFDRRGNPVASQVSGDTLVFMAKDVPSVGYETFWLRPASQTNDETSLQIGEGFIENRFYRLEINPQTGNWSRLYDKRLDREILKTGEEGNVLQAFEDLPQAWDAWNIGYTGREWKIEDVEKTEVVEDGPVRAALRVTRTSGESRFVQDIVLYSDLPRIDVLNRFDWHEEHVLLKVAFPVNVRSEVATYEIPYGTIERRTVPLTPQDSAKYEVSAQKWIDLSDGQYGIGLLNDSKYGHDVKDDVMRITLLRSPKYPDPEADMGSHIFTYSVYPHAGDWKQARTYRQGYELNYPLLAVIETPHKGDLPAHQSFASIEPDNVILSAMKKADDSDDLVLRLYELFGNTTRATITLSRNFQSAVETDLLENAQSPLETEKDSINILARPYEIKTVMARF